MGALAIRVNTVDTKLALSLESGGGNIRESGEIELEIDALVALPAILKALNARTYDPADFADEERTYLHTHGLLDGEEGAPGVGFAEELRERVGELLFRHIFPNEEMLLALGEASQAMDGLQLELCFSEDSDIASALPWELLCRKRSFLVGGGGTITRCLELSKHAPPWTPLELDRLRVLVVTPRPAGLATLGETELEALKDIDRVEVMQLPAQTIETFGPYLLAHGGPDAPHVIHFDGHGLYGRRCDACGWVSARLTPECERCRSEELETRPRGYLAWERPDGGLRWLRADAFAQQVGAVMQRGDSCLRLVVVSACRSAEATGRQGAGGSAFSGVAQSLLRANVPAVMAMQFEIRADHATTLTRAFYTGIVGNQPLPRALSWARIQAESLDIKQWYCPVLFLRAGSNREGRFFVLSNRTSRPARSPDWSPSEQPALDEPAGTPESLAPDQETDPVEAARQGIARIAALVERDHALADKLYTRANDFAEVAMNLQLLGEYKALHDHLHEMYQTVYTPSRDQVDDFDRSSFVRSAITNHERMLRRHIEELVDLAENTRGPAQADMRTSIEELERVDTMLGEGLDHRHRRQVASAVRLLGSQLARRTMQVNTCIVKAAEALHIQKVIEALRSIEHEAAGLRGAHALDRVQRELQPLVTEHNLWQELDPDLHRLASAPITTPEELIDDWPDVSERLLRLCGGRASGKVDQLLAAHARVKDAVMRAVESERGRRPASLLREVRETYRICERDAGARFLNVDRELKRLCEQLRALHGPMNDLARALTLVTA